MNIVKREKSKNYTTISNVFLRDKALSIKAKGLLAVIMSLPEDWEFTINGICSVLKEGRTAIYSAIQELKDCGYCNVDICRNEKGLITGNDYTFRESPKLEEQYNEKPHTENLNADNETQRNKEETNNRIDEIKKEKEEIDKSISKKDDYLPFAAEPQQEYGDKPKKKRNATPKDDPLFEECWKAYNRRGNKEKAKVYWDKICEEERNNILPHIKAYVQSRDRQYQSYFERYLRDKSFNDVVYKGNSVLYDPEMYDDKQTYHPHVEFPYLCQKEDDGKYYFTGNIINLADGYTRENRPNGAQVHQNGYTYTWNAEKKDWDVK